MLFGVLDLGFKGERDLVIFRKRDFSKNDRKFPQSKASFERLVHSVKMLVWKLHPNRSAARRALLLWTWFIEISAVRVFSGTYSARSPQ